MVSDVFQPKWQMQLLLIGFLGSSQKEPWLVSLNIAHSFNFCWWFLEVSQDILLKYCKSEAPPSCWQNWTFCVDKGLQSPGLSCLISFIGNKCTGKKRERESRSGPFLFQLPFCVEAQTWVYNMYHEAQIYIYIHTHIFNCVLLNIQLRVWKDSEMMGCLYG